MAIAKADNHVINLGASGDEVTGNKQVQGFHIPTGCTLTNSAGVLIGEGVSDLGLSSPLQVQGIKHGGGTGTIVVYLA